MNKNLLAIHAEIVLKFEKSVASDNLVFYNYGNRLMITGEVKTIKEICCFIVNSEKASTVVFTEQNNKEAAVTVIAKD